MPMVNDSSNFPYGGENKRSAKLPNISSINFIKQFARVYSATHGIEFSYMILI